MGPAKRLVSILQCGRYSADGGSAPARMDHCADRQERNLDRYATSRLAACWVVGGCNRADSKTASLRQGYSGVVAVVLRNADPRRSPPIDCAGFGTSLALTFLRVVSITILPA